VDEVSQVRDLEAGGRREKGEYPAPGGIREIAVGVRTDRSLTSGTDGAHSRRRSISYWEMGKLAVPSPTNLCAEHVNVAIRPIPGELPYVPVASVPREAPTPLAFLDIARGFRR